VGFLTSEVNISLFVVSPRYFDTARTGAYFSAAPVLWRGIYKSHEENPSPLVLVPQSGVFNLQPERKDFKLPFGIYKQGRTKIL
jgi:hypothetical protein